MASLDRLPAELLVMIHDEILDFDDDIFDFDGKTEVARALYSLSLTNRRFYFMFNNYLYKYDALYMGKAMAWGAFFGRLDIMKKSKAAGASYRREVLVTPAAVTRALGGFRPRAYPAILATAGGQNDVLDWLTKKGVATQRDTSVRQSDGMYTDKYTYHGWWTNQRWSSMYWAILFNHKHTVRHLLSRGVSPILTADGDVTAMHAAAAMGRETMFDLFLSLPGCDLRAQDARGNTALHYAARGFFDVDLAVSSGRRSCPITGKPHDPITKASTIASLVHHGADIHATNMEGQSPMVLALSVTPSQWEAALPLLDLEPADFVPSDNLIATTLTGCATTNPGTKRTAFLSRILTSATLNRLYHVPGTPLNIGSHRSWHNNAGKKSAPLMWYIVQGCSQSIVPLIDFNPHAIEDTFVELLDLGALPGGQDSRARTPLHACVFAAMTGRTWTYWHSFDFPDKTLGPDDALPQAATKVPFIFIDILLRRGASLEAQDSKGLTPLEYALEKTHANATRAAYIHAFARNVVRLVLLQAWVVSGDFKSPSEDIKRRLVDKLGVGILAPLDPLKGELDLSED